MKEINKLVENLNKKMSQYSAKVPEQVRKEDQEKMKKYESEQALLKE